MQDDLRLVCIAIIFVYAYHIYPNNGTLQCPRTKLDFFFKYIFKKLCKLFCAFMSVCDFLVKLGMSVRGDTKKTPIILFTCTLITAINNRKTVVLFIYFCTFCRDQ